MEGLLPTFPRVLPTTLRVGRSLIAGNELTVVFQYCIDAFTDIWEGAASQISGLLSKVEILEPILEGGSSVIAGNELTVVFQYCIDAFTDIWGGRALQDSADLEGLGVVLPPVGAVGVGVKITGGNEEAGSSLIAGNELMVVFQYCIDPFTDIWGGRAPQIPGILLGVTDGLGALLEGNSSVISGNELTVLFQYCIDAFTNIWPFQVPLVDRSA